MTRCRCSPDECLHPLFLRDGFICAVQQAALDALRSKIEQLGRLHFFPLDNHELVRLDQVLDLLPSEDR